jgi:ethanolamine utilization microcompartment shell protein EutL
MADVMKKIGDVSVVSSEEECSVKCNMTEFVGASPIGDTIGLVIANVDNGLHKAMGIDEKYRSIGILGSRTGAGPHIMAADEAVKATNTEILKIELARDTKGGAGHGCLIVFGSEDVSDAQRAKPLAMFTPMTRGTQSFNTPREQAMPSTRHSAPR